MNNKKQVLMAAAAGIAGIMISANAQAALNGPYLGGGLGWGNINQPNFFGQNTSNSEGLAGRIFAGYQINEYFGLETGYSKFSNMDETVSSINPVVSVDGTIKTYAVDVVGKVTLPLQNGISLFGKLGGAYLNENATVTISDFSGVLSGSSTADKILPTYGLGAGYDINQNLTTDVSWMRIQKVGNDSDLQSTDMVTIGLTYHF